MKTFLNKIFLLSLVFLALIVIIVSFTSEKTSAGHLPCDDYTCQAEIGVQLIPHSRTITAGQSAALTLNMYNYSGPSHTVINGNSCNLKDDSNGSVVWTQSNINSGASFNISVSPAGTRNYTATCIGGYYQGTGGDTISHTVTVTVNSPPPNCKVSCSPFSNDPVAAGATQIRAIHIYELRNCADIIRSSCGFSVYPWTDPSISAGASKIRAVHFNEIFSAIQPACAKNSFTCSWTNVTANSPIKAVHMDNLRKILKLFE